MRVVSWFLLLLCSVLTGVWLAGCSFHLPHQTSLSEALPEINIEGAYHHDFYKMMVQKLRISGVKVNAEGDTGYSKNDTAPTLMVPEPTVDNIVVAVDSRAQALERNLFISVAMTLYIPQHRPILMRNSLTRTVLNKAGHSLSSQNEINIVTHETYDELSSQMVLRLGYLGRESDPDARTPLPQDLTVSIDDPNSAVSVRNPYEGMTLIEALRAQDSAEQSQGKSVSLDELNNQRSVLGRPSVPTEEYKLPPVRPELRHQAPASVSTDF